MKAKIGLLLGSIILSACHTYRSVDMETTRLREGKKYRVITKLNEKHKLRILSDGDTLVGKGPSGILINLAKKDLLSVEECKFSITRTLGLHVLIVGTAYGVIAITEPVKNLGNIYDVQ